jgi:uncharacterized protein YjcR
MGYTKIQNDIRNECEKLYVYDSLSVPKIAEKMGVKECTIRHWHERQNPVLSCGATCPAR